MNSQIPLHTSHMAIIIYNAVNFIIAPPLVPYSFTDMISQNSHTSSPNVSCRQKISDNKQIFID